MIMDNGFENGGGLDVPDLRDATLDLGRIEKRKAAHAPQIGAARATAYAQAIRRSSRAASMALVEGRAGRSSR
jgi:hypothetical protein